MNRGPLGLPRLTGLGPLTTDDSGYRQEIEGLESFKDEVQELAQQSTTGDVEEITQILAENTFPDSERKQQRFMSCLDSNWSSGWEQGFSGSSGFDGDSTNNALEELAMQATACAGLVESSTIDVEN